jgi:putative ABC transport system permease protein
MTPFKLALLNLSRRRIPSTIAIISIAISIACSGILLRLNKLSEARFSTLGHGGDAIVGAKAGGIEIMLSALNGEGDYPGYLPYKLFQSLRAEQSVRFEDGTQSRPSFIRSIIPFVYFAKYGNFRVVGTDETFLKRPDPTDSPAFKDGRWATEPGEIVIGSQVADQENLQVGNTIAVQPWAGEQVPGGSKIELKITGILASTSSAWDRMLYSNLPTAQKTLASLDLGKISIWGPEVLNYFLVYLEPKGFDALSSLVNRRTVGQAILVSEQKIRLENLTGTGEKLGSFVTILILALSALAVTSMLITRFDAMALQLAVLRAIGYKKGKIGAWLLWEGFLLGITACALGIALDAIGFPIMRSLLSDTLPPADIVQSSILQSAPIWLTAIAATTASVFIPMYRIYHQDIHFSLRN